MRISKLEVWASIIGILVGVLILADTFISSQELSCRYEVIGMKQQLNEKQLTQVQTISLANTFFSTAVSTLLQNQKGISKQMEDISLNLMNDTLDNAKEINKLTNETIKKEQSCNGYLKKSYPIRIAVPILYMISLTLFILIYSKLKK